MIKRFFIVEGMDSNAIASQIFDEIHSTIGEKVSPQWIAGILTGSASSYSGPRAILKSYLDGMYEPSQQPSDLTPEQAKKFQDKEAFKAARARDAQNYQKFYEILYKHGLIDKRPYRNGFDYEISRSGKDKRRNEILSILRSKSPENAGTRISQLDKTKKDMLDAEYKGAEEYIQNMPEELRAAYESFNALDEKEIAYLNHLLDLRKEAKEKHGTYTDKVLDAIQSGKPWADSLVNLGFLDEATGKINLDAVQLAQSLFDSEKAGIFELRTHMKTAYNMLKRLASIEAIQENAFVKNNIGTPLAKEAEEFVKNMSDYDKELLLRDKMVKKFVDYGLLTINKEGKGRWTQKGKAVKLLVRNNKSSFAEVAKDISMATGRDENTPELAPSSPVKRSRLLRKGQLERKQSRIIKNETFSQFFYKNLLTELKK